MGGKLAYANLIDQWKDSMNGQESTMITLPAKTPSSDDLALATPFACAFRLPMPRCAHRSLWLSHARSLQRHLSELTLDFLD